MLVLGAAALSSCGGESKKTALAPAPVEIEDVAVRTARPRGGRVPLIWVGLDGLDWDFMDRLSAQGKVPNWARLAAGGYGARLASFIPILSPVVWTTETTGVGPDLHGVLDFQEIDPVSRLKVPISGASRAVPAVWNIASAEGRSVGVVGFWATHPAEEVRGFFISDRASPILFSSSSFSGSAFPAALDELVALVASKDGRISARDLAPYLNVPAEEIAASLESGAGMESRIVALSRILSATRTTQRLSRDLYDREHPDLMAVYFEGTDEIGHVFAPLTPPKLPCVSDADFDRFGHAAATYFEAVDEILGQWMRRAREDGATLLITSDHGFKWGAERTCERSSSEASTAGFWHRIDGVFAAWGERVQPARERGAASVFDVAPTILSLLDLPLDRRMTGKAVAAAFPGMPAPRREDLFSKIAAHRVRAGAVTASEAGEYAKKLHALGYLSGGEPERASAPAASGNGPERTEGAYNNLGLYERDTSGRPDLAERDFRKALELRPTYSSPIFNLAVLFRSRGKDGEAVEWLFRSLAAGHADPEGTLAQWAAQYRKSGNPPRAESLLLRGIAAYPRSESLSRALADIRFQAHDCAGAWRAVSGFETSTNDPETLNVLALCQTCLGNRAQAIADFERSIALRPGQPGVVSALKVLGAAAAPGVGK